MAYSNFAEYTVGELQGYFSDFHKAFYGFRPTGLYSVAEFTDREFLIARINAIHDAMDAMKQTPEGREELRRDGWVIDEPEVIDPREYAEWSAELDAEYYGEVQ